MHNVVFIGTSEFAVPSLEALLKDPRFTVLAVITQPDRPVGRHAELTPPPVKVCAEKYSLPIFQPEKLSELNPSLSSTVYRLPSDIEAFVLASYGKILPPWFLDLPKHGVINVHPSLLPRWRGATPMQAAIASGDKKTGVTIMKLDAELDHGPILAQEETEINDTDTGETLSKRLAELGAAMLPRVLVDYLEGKLEPREQVHIKATFSEMLTRDEGKIDWNKSCHEIERLIRAYTPWPGTWMEVDGKRVKILAVRIRPNDAAYPIGSRFVWKGRPSVKCGKNTVLELVTVQPEVKKLMSGEEFVRGNRAWPTLEKMNKES